MISRTSWTLEVKFISVGLEWPAWAAMEESSHRMAPLAQEWAGQAQPGGWGSAVFTELG